MRGSTMSSANFVWPTHFARASTLRNGLPMTFRSFPFLLRSFNSWLMHPSKVSLGLHTAPSPSRKHFLSAIHTLRHAFVLRPAPLLHKFLCSQYSGKGSQTVHPEFQVWWV